MAELLSEDVKITRVLANVADGQTDSNTSSVDMTGFDGVLFLITIGTITGSGTSTWTVEQSSDDSTFNAVSGAEVDATGSAESDTVLILDVKRPLDRYVHVAYVRATANSEIDGVVALQYGARSKASAVSGLTDYDQVVSPAES